MEEYRASLGSEVFARMETFSDAFLKRNRKSLLYYSLRWSHDPLHHATRQWEYPFIFERIQAAPPTQVLDAGSGVTFFPYYVQREIPGSQVTCCDYDTYAASRYPLLNHTEDGRDVAFERGDLRELPFESDRFDAIYTVSVLEHTSDYARVLDEFRRVLRPGGTLLVTFDISLDGRKDIPVAEAQRLLELLNERFDPKEAPALELEGPIYTSEAGRQCVPSRPIWDSYQAAVRIAKSVRLGAPKPSSMTFYCGEYAL